MKWSLHLPSAFLSLTPSNHRPGVTRMTTDSHSGGDDGASSSITAVTATPPRESTAPIAPAASASAGKKSSSSRSRRRRRRLFSFAEARRMARGHGFDSREEFHEYSCPGAYQIPKDADVVWKEVRYIDRVVHCPGREDVPPLSPPLAQGTVPSPEMRYMEWIFYSSKKTHRPRVRIYIARRASRHNLSVLSLAPPSRAGSMIPHAHTNGEKRNGGDGRTFWAYRFRSRKVGRSRDRSMGSMMRVPISISSGVGRYPTTTPRAGCRTGRIGSTRTTGWDGTIS